ncbi:MAG: HyaD/HybD family hydrogenase maturation endopeptidase [Candidatus Marinimicrobia bacterium]|nr:hydrogenase maturation protease [Candidatus Neomarinimicrobiota bacterium]MDP6033210.1 HyaD/HybD family hydrogenase maturation endopeptidase [Candidatus Neomarinimicrobiota bacterium]
MEQKINVLGLGNIILGDEAFGVEAVRLLEANSDFPANVNIIDGGTQGVYLLDYIESADSLLIFDAIIPQDYDFKVYVYQKENLPSFIHRKMSSHQIGLSELLSIAKLHGKVPKEVALIGIPPKNMDINVGLTKEVQNLVPKAVEKGKEIIMHWLEK